MSFPTETVYGLGAHALDEHSVARIFEAKGRPRTDPLIVHVATLEAAEPLLRLTPHLRALVERLAATFWPGPLTLVLPASDRVPACVTAGLKSVGIRIPQHPVACALLMEAGVPVAAPSANRFGHVSPTRAEHVAADLGDQDVFILDGGDCPVGIESTILRGEDDAVTLLRRGYVTLLEVRDALAGLLPPEAIRATPRPAPSSTGDDPSRAQIAPGQLLTHYAPDVPAFLVAPGTTPAALPTGWDWTGTVVIDVGERLAAFHARAAALRKLKDDEALAQAFSALRWAEAVPGARRILLPDLGESHDERMLALADRLYRSASGRTVGAPSPTP